MNTPETETLILVGAVMALLGIATGAGQLLKRRLDTGLNPAVVAHFHLRIRTWWLMWSVLAVASFLGATVAVVLFGLISFWALREFITLTPTRRGDHRALFWVFFLFTPLQYVLVGMDLPEYYSVWIPVCGFLFVTSRVAFAGDFKRFLERTAKILAGLMISVYCLSYAPALLTHEGFREPVRETAPVPGQNGSADGSPNGTQPAGSISEPAAESPPTPAAAATDATSPIEPWESRAPAWDPLAEEAPVEDAATQVAPIDEASADAARSGEPSFEPAPPAHDEATATPSPAPPARRRLPLPDRARLLFYFVLVVQLGDIMQYVWGKLVGKSVIAPEISPEKTWEGFFGGVASATLLGTLLWWATPFAPWEAAAVSVASTFVGFAGGMTMSAIKRDRGVKDYGTLVAGHGGVLDRIDSICFAAPVFFYLTKLILHQPL